MINCPKCKDVEMIWGGDHDNEDDMDDKQYLVMSNFSCPKCETFVYVNWSEKNGE
jgi:phage FluMu protein Com|tara:strand:+ start:45 stop:209 length:165 start_codon:yes stop_codon:yes gene_type:complete